MKPNNTKKLVYSALFLALALVLPFLTGQIQTFGQMLAPMHLPVLLCGFVCGPVCGAAAAQPSVQHAPHVPHRCGHGL